MVPSCQVPLTVKSRCPDLVQKDCNVCDSLSTVPGSQINAQNTVAAVIVIILIYRIKMSSCLFATPFWAYFL